MLDKFSPKIIFFGTPDFAVASLKALIAHNFNVVAVITAPDKPAGRGRKLHESAVKTYAQSQSLTILQPEKLKNKDFLAELFALKADLQIVVAFRMLPEVIWNSPKLGTINIHGSLLPQYRGAAPINWAIINGEKVTGVTSFKLQQEIDTGPILLQKESFILPEDNMGTMYEKLMAQGASLLIETINGLVEETISEQVQDLSKEIKHAPKIFKEDCKIDWNNNAEHIHNLIRGLSPYPTAFTFIEEKQFKIFSSSFEISNHHLTAGIVETDGKTFLRFTAKDGWINCLNIQFEGKKRMDITDFLRGWRRQ